MIQITYEQVAEVCKIYYSVLDELNSIDDLNKCGVRLSPKKNHDYILFVTLISNKVGFDDTKTQDEFFKVLGRLWVKNFESKEYYYDHLADDFKEAGLSIRDAIKKATLKQLLPTKDKVK